MTETKSKKWYQSKTIWGVFIAALGYVMAQLQVQEGKQIVCVSLIRRGAGNPGSARNRKCRQPDTERGSQDSARDGTAGMTVAWCPLHATAGSEQNGNVFVQSKFPFLIL